MLDCSNISQYIYNSQTELKQNWSELHSEQILNFITLQ